MATNTATSVECHDAAEAAAVTLSPTIQPWNSSLPVFDSVKTLPFGGDAHPEEKGHFPVLSKARAGSYTVSPTSFVHKQCTIDLQRLT